MSKNEVTSSKNVKSQREKELDEEINLFRKRAKDWLQDINDEHRKETKQLIAENKELKDKISDLRNKLKEAHFIKPKTTPPEVRKAEADAMAKLQAENAGYKKANEELQKQISDLEHKLETANDEKDCLITEYKKFNKVNQKLTNKVFEELDQLNSLRAQVGMEHLPEESVMEEIKGYEN